MRKQYEIGHSIRELAEGYDLHRETVADIVHYRTHKRVKEGKAPPIPKPRTPKTEAEKVRRVVSVEEAFRDKRRR